jgi:DNA-binding FrmR family transcriptional regulator
MKIENSETKSKLIQRLKRIEGQVRGVQTMLEQERSCQEILQQLTAIHSAVQSTSRTFFQCYALTCMADLEGQPKAAQPPEQQARLEKIVQEMITLLDKTP